MAKVQLFAALGTYGWFTDHLTGRMKLESSSKTSVVFEDSGGAELRITGRNLETNKDGIPTGGVATSATFYDDDGHKLVTFSDFNISAKALWNGTITNGWLWSDQLKEGFTGMILSGKDTVIGSSKSDQVIGWTGSDRLVAGNGDDRIYAWYGNDVVLAGAGDDYIDLGADSDRALGGSGKDQIRGFSGNDWIKGEAGNDALNGDTGKDKLSGGEGGDRFIYLIAEDSRVAESGRDVILDFEKGEDTLWLKSMDASRKNSGNQNFEWIGTQEFSGDAGELRMEVEGRGKAAQTIVSADLNGDERADFAFALNGDYDLKPSDFAL